MTQKSREKLRLHIRAEQISDKSINGEQETFIKILRDREYNRNHNWFSKTKLKLDNGPPLKIYTSR